MMLRGDFIFMETVYLGVGSNLGDREKYIQQAIQYLRETPGISVKKISSLHETDPVGGPPQGKYLNGAIEIETRLSPRELLTCVKNIEKGLGRKERMKNWPREIDLDILLYGNQMIQEPGLEIPHPHMRERDFVLIPLREIAAHAGI